MLCLLTAQAVKLHHTCVEPCLSEQHNTFWERADQLSTAPVALFIFNRPEHTQRVFDQIRAYKPSQLLVIADGPRNAVETMRCGEARAIIDQVDWECDVATNFSDVNLGCNRRLISGLDWVFDRCEEAIVLEDDCLPHASFFRYCNDLLSKYRDDSRVMFIGGTTLVPDHLRTPYSYYFSRHQHVWGWASWRRSWRHYDENLTLWPFLRNTGWLQDMVESTDAIAYWRIIFDSLCAGGTTWDHGWTFACWTQNGLTITPNVNLISNIGFDELATHAQAVEKKHQRAVSDLPTSDMTFPLRHPPYMLRHREADVFEFNHVVSHDLYHRLRRRISSSLSEQTRGQIYRCLSRAQQLSRRATHRLRARQKTKQVVGRPVSYTGRHE